MPESTPSEDAEAIRDVMARAVAAAEEGDEDTVEAILAEHPGFAPKLRRRLASLREAGLLGRPVAESDLEEGGELGDFRLLRKLGEGGMGIVFLAEQISLRRRVALKLVRPGHLLFDGARERFRREVEAIARLQHPGIVPIHLVGEERGVPFFAMENIEGASVGALLSDLAGRAPRDLAGRSLAEALAERLPGANALYPHAASGWLFEGSWTDTCLRIAQQAAEALDHAHHRGVLHRDVKPSNLMVTPAGRVLLLDFGLAVTQGSDRLTRTGAQLGSLPYLSPEQVRGDLGAIDARTDVYELGVTLYEMLTLRTPHEGSTADATIARILQGRPAPIRTANPQVSWDAETVCITAMDPDPRRRYATAADFARDLGNVLQRRPIEARRPGLARRVRRWVQRHPAWSVAIVLGGLVVTVGPTVFAVHERGTRIAIEASARRATALRLTAASGNALPSDPGLSLLLAIEGARLLPGSLANRALLAALDACREIRTLEGHGGPNGLARFSPDGSLLATAGDDCLVRLHDGITGAERGLLRGHELRVHSVSFSADGARILTASQDRSARLWDAATRACVATLRGHDGEVRGAEFLRGGSEIVTASTDGSLLLWDAATGGRLGPLAETGSPQEQLAVAEGGRFVASAGADGTVRLFDAAGRRETAALRHGGSVRSLRFDATGRRIVTASVDGSARVFSVPDGEPLGVHRAPPRILVNMAAFDPTGTRVASGSSDRTVRLWDAETGEELAAPIEHDRTVRCITWSRDGRQLATGGDDQLLRLFRGDDLRPIAVLGGHGGRVAWAEFSSDGARIASAGDGARLWRAARPVEIADPPSASAPAIRVALSPDGARTADAAQDGACVVRSAEDGSVIATLAPHAAPAWGARFSEDGRRVATCSDDRLVRVHDAESGATLATLEHPRASNAAAFGLDGTRLFTACADRVVRRFEWRSGRLEASSAPLAEALTCIDASPDGAHVAAGFRDGSVRILDAETLAERAVLTGHSSSVLDVRFSADSARLVTGGYDRTARVWSVPAGLPLALLPGSRDAIFGVAFSPDGRLVATASGDRSVRLFDARAGLEVSLDAGFAGIVYAVVFDAEGRRAIGASPLGAARSFPVDALAEALARRPRDLTVAEHIEHEVGDPEAWRAAEAALDEARARCALAEDVAADLRTASFPSREARTIALELASKLRDHPQTLAYGAWAVVRAPGRTRAEYEHALRRAAAAAEAIPESGDFQRGLGVALFRVGRFAEAAEWLAKPESASDHETPDDQALTQGFLVRAYEEIGRAEEARAARARLEAIVRATPRADARLHASLPELAASR